MRKLATYLLALLLSCAFVQAQELDFPAPADSTIDDALVDAVQIYNDGDFDSARTRLRRLSELSPDNDAVLYYLGLSEFNLGDADSSLVHIGRAAAIDSTNAWYRNGLATVLVEQGRTQEAVPLLKKLVDEQPQSFANSYVFSMLGDASMAEYKDSLAMDYYGRALEYEPDYAPAILGQAEINRIRGNFPAFFSGFKQIVDNPKVIPSIKTSYLKAMTERMDARFYWVWGKQMEEMVDTCISLHPKDLEARDLKIEYCAIRRDTAALVRNCEQLLRYSAADSARTLKALSILGDTYHSQGDAKKAYKTYERALRLNPEYSPVLNNYAYFLCCEGRKLKKAARMSAITIEQEPDNPTYLDTYGWILHLLGRDAEAKPLFKHAMIYGGKNSAEVLRHYSEVLKALGEKDLSDYYRMLSESK